MATIGSRALRTRIARYALLGTLAGGASAALSALACRGPLLASIALGTAAAAAASAVYGYARRRAEARP